MNIFKKFVGIAAAMMGFTSSLKSKAQANGETIRSTLRRMARSRRKKLACGNKQNKNVLKGIQGRLTPRHARYA